MAKRAQIADRPSPGAFLFNMNHAAKTFGFRFLCFGPVIDYTAERDVLGYSAIEKRHCRGNPQSGQGTPALDRKKEIDRQRRGRRLRTSGWTTRVSPSLAFFCDSFIS